MSLKKVEISIGLIKLKSSFVCLKRTSQPYKNFIEFPGGKKKNNETAIQCLKREIKEELNIDILIKNKLGEENYKDKKINVKLHYFFCSFIKGDIKLIEHEDSAWVNKNQLKYYDFAEGDSDIISLL